MKFSKNRRSALGIVPPYFEFSTFFAQLFTDFSFAFPIFQNPAVIAAVRRKRVFHSFHRSYYYYYDLLFILFIYFPQTRNQERILGNRL